MAVAKAQARSGVQGIHIWLIVFVALWLTSTVLLVLLYTDQADLKLRNEELAADVDKLISGSEKSSLSYYAQARADKTAVGLADAARAATAKEATGLADDSPQVVRTKRTELAGRIREDGIVPDPQSFSEASFLEALTALYTAFKAEHEQLTQLQARNSELTAQTEQLSAANAAQKTEFQTQVAQMQEKLGELMTGLEEFRKAKEEQVAGMDRKLTEIDQRFSADIQEQRRREQAVTAQYDELKSRFSDLSGRLGELQIRPEERITARQGDGKVVSARPGDDVVYVDLGRNANLVLGLKFAVYPRSGIPADGKAKARVEVVNIFPSSAECRIVEVHGRDPIMEGDLIANPIYDRERELHFMVLGRFDVNGDGSPDSEGAEQIESLIRSWGGVVDTELSARVDFLVLGEAPPKPVTAGDSPEAAEREEAARQVYEAFEQTVQAAQNLSIPVLPQRVFMHFLGYR